MTRALYETLQIEPGATQDDIREAYLRLAKAYHPDMNGGQDPEGRFLAVSNAYHELCRVETPEEETDKVACPIQIEIPLPAIFAGGRHVSPLLLRERCLVCAGKGEIGKRICPACEGKGHHPLQGEVSIDIPQHSPEGTILEARFTCPQRPETLIQVSIMDAPHPAFRRVGLDIRARLVIPRRAAKQGGRFVIKGPSGDHLCFLLPGGSRTGHQVTVPGAGSPHRDGENSGNLILDIIVEQRRPLGSLLLAIARLLKIRLQRAMQISSTTDLVSKKQNGAA